MLSGAMMLLFGSLTIEGALILSTDGAVMIIWLAIANTTAAFFLWNRALVELRAYEQSILQNTMLIQITIMAIIFLGEGIDISNFLGICMVFIRVMIVVIKRKEKGKFRVAPA